MSGGDGSGGDGAWPEQVTGLGHALAVAQTTPDEVGAGEIARPHIVEIPRATAIPDFSDFYREYAPFVHRVLKRMGLPASDSDDAVHEVFLVAYRRRTDLYDASYARSWLYGIARRVAAKFRRQANRKVRDVSTMPEVANPREGFEQLDAARLARRCIEQVDERRRMVFVLVELEGMSAPEVADALGLNVNTVYSRLRKARAEFENELRRLTEAPADGGSDDGRRE